MNAEHLLPQNHCNPANINMIQRLLNWLQNEPMTGFSMYQLKGNNFHLCTKQWSWMTCTVLIITTQVLALSICFFVLGAISTNLSTLSWSSKNSFPCRGWRKLLPAAFFRGRPKSASIETTFWPASWHKSNNIYDTNSVPCKLWILLDMLGRCSHDQGPCTEKKGEATQLMPHVS